MPFNITTMSLVIYIISSFVANSVVAEKKENFKGISHWNEDHLRQCEAPRNEYYKQADLGCYTYFSKDLFETICMELISRNPILIVFRKLADDRQIEKFLEEVRKQKMKEQRTLNSETGRVETSTFRRSNGTTFFHKETPTIAAQFRRVQKVLPNVNLDISDHWGINSYQPNGHYAVHSDYLDFPNEESWDPLTKYFGNRWATFLLILKTADAGGGTVFPNIGTTVFPEAGDAIFWTNMNTDRTQNKDANHGACPIIKGQKIAATLWIRENYQPLLNDGKKLFNAKYFLQPSLFTAQCPF